MMRWILLCLLTALGGTSALSAADLPRFDFENGTDGWVSFSPAGQVSTTNDRQHVRAGQSALEYRFEGKKGEITALAVPVPGGLAGMRSLQLDVRTDSPTAVLVMLVEEGDARYQYASATTAGWLHLAIDTTEFARADDSPDANGKLDLDRVRYIALLDVLSVWGAADPNLSTLFGPRPGQHAIWLDNVVAGEQAILPPAPAGQVVIDDFRTENLGWLPLIGVSVAVGAAPAGAEGRALRVEYPRAAGKLTGVVRFIHPGRLAGMRKLTFSAAAQTDTTLMVALEEVGGARYLATATLQAGVPPQAFSLSLTDFKLTDDTRDADGRLDPEQVKSIAFADLAGLTDPNAAGANVLWLQQVRAMVPTGALESR